MTGIYGKINYICLTDFNKEKLLELKQIKPERVFVKPNFVECKNEYVLEKDRQIFRFYRKHQEWNRTVYKSLQR